MSNPRANLCQKAAPRVIAVLIGLVGCGGAVAPVDDANPLGIGPAATACPSKSAIDQGTAIGQSCASEGLWCPSPACDPCNENCRAVACTRGRWASAVNTALCTGPTPPPSPTDDVDSSVCITIDATSFDQTCTSDSDCLQVGVGTVCTSPISCLCPAAAINVSAKAAYDDQLKAAESLPKGQGGCLCPYFGKPSCVANRCTVCGGASSCNDGG